MQLSQLFTYLILLTRKECSSKPHETPWLLLDSWSIKAYLPLLYSLSDAHQSEKDKERFLSRKTLQNGDAGADSDSKFRFGAVNVRIINKQTPDF